MIIFGKRTNSVILLEVPQNGCQRSKMAHLGAFCQLWGPVAQRLYKIWPPCSLAGNKNPHQIRIGSPPEAPRQSQGTEEVIQLLLHMQSTSQNYCKNPIWALHTLIAWLITWRLTACVGEAKCMCHGGRGEVLFHRDQTWNPLHNWWHTATKVQNFESDSSSVLSTSRTWMPCLSKTDWEVPILIKFIKLEMLGSIVSRLTSPRKILGKLNLG